MLFTSSQVQYNILILMKLKDRAHENKVINSEFPKNQVFFWNRKKSHMKPSIWKIKDCTNGSRNIIFFFPL